MQCGTLVQVNGPNLFILGRRLMRLGEQAIPTTGIGTYSTSNRMVLTVAADIDEHPQTTVQEIADRTDFAQSQVSLAVARLKSADAIVTGRDPNDGRRTLISANPRDSERVATVNAADVYEAVLASCDGDADRARRAVSLLTELAELLPARPSRR